MANPGKEKKKKVVKSCGCESLCVFNYNIAIELWVMETENSQKLFSVSITHNSKIRELSDGNRVIVCQTNFLLWVPPFLSYELWKQRIKLSKNSIQTGSEKLLKVRLKSMRQCKAKVCHSPDPFKMDKIFKVSPLWLYHVRRLGCIHVNGSCWSK